MAHKQGFIIPWLCEILVVSMMTGELPAHKKNSSTQTIKIINASPGRRQFMLFQG
jgi:hypothetical protein